MQSTTPEAATGSVKAQSPPPPPQAATALVQAPTPPASITTVGPDGKPVTLTIPKTTAELRELQVQRQELSDQLTSVASRRRNLAVEVQSSEPGTARSGLEARLQLLDQRILQLETDLATTGRQIAAAPASLTAAAQLERRNDGDDFEEGLMIGGFFSLLFAIPIVIFFARRRWKRRGRGIPAQAGDSTERLERLENGMDAIAIEIERISEGQRFVTKLLSESQLPLEAPRRIAQSAAVEKDPANP
jgi:hypothetical protein